jgi:hypothetical protein
LKPDWQKKYPEVKKGNYQRLIDWVATYGVTHDSLRSNLRPYLSFYTENASEKFKPLATLMDIYNLRADLQAKYPETLNGDNKHLIAWACEVSSLPTDRGDLTAKRLSLYKSWYEAKIQ